jgi:hypothetical protein
MTQRWGRQILRGLHASYEEPRRQVAGGRGTVDREPTHGMQRPPPVVCGRLPWHQNQ